MFTAPLLSSLGNFVGALFPLPPNRIMEQKFRNERVKDNATSFQLEDVVSGEFSVPPEVREREGGGGHRYKEKTTTVLTK